MRVCGLAGRSWDVDLGNVRKSIRPLAHVVALPLCRIVMVWADSTALA